MNLKAIACLFLFSSTVSATDLTKIGEAARNTTKKIVEYGPRPPGSETLSKVQAYIEKRLRDSGYRISSQRFNATTPTGKIAMKNVVGSFGPMTNFIILSCHLDSKMLGGINFVGANDSASACALILELAPLLKNAQLKTGLQLAFFDGEEAIVNWTPTDSLYGSRHMARQLLNEKREKQVKAMINLDMISDYRLEVARELYSDGLLLERIAKIADAKNYSQYFYQYAEFIEDDHVPFKRIGIPAVDFIDFRNHDKDGNSVWHTEKDTIDNVSSKSLQIIAEVVFELIQQLGKE